MKEVRIYKHIHGKELCDICGKYTTVFLVIKSKYKDYKEIYVCGECIDSLEMEESL